MFLKYLFFGISPLGTTIIVFSIILICFIIIPLHYSIIGQKEMRIIQCKSLFLDWHFWVPCLVYTILLGYRWNYYYDWMQYHDDFIYIDRPDIVRESTERGYLLVNKLLSMLGFDFYSIFLLEGFIYIFSIYYVFKDNRAMLLFVLPIVFIDNRTGLNISRQYFAISIMLIAFKKMLDGQNIQFFIIALLASQIHTSALIYIIPFYFSKKIQLPSIWITLLVYFSTLLLMPYMQSIFVFLSGFFQGNILGDKMYTSLVIMEDRFQRDITFHRLFVQSCKDIAFIILLYYYRNIIKFDKKINTILSIAVYAMFFRNIAGPHEIFSRFFYYITIITNMGMGVIFYIVYKDVKRIPFYYILASFIVCLQTVYSLYAGIIDAAKNTLTNTMIIYK